MKTNMNTKHWMGFDLPIPLSNDDIKQIESSVNVTNVIGYYVNQKISLNKPCIGVCLAHKGKKSWIDADAVLYRTADDAKVVLQAIRQVTYGIV